MRAKGKGFIKASTKVMLLLFSAFISVWSPNLLSKNNDLDSYLAQLKADYELLMASAQSGRQQSFLRLAQRHESHPLLPYAQAEYLASSLDINKKAVINQFIEHYDGAPFVRSLKLKWLNYLAANRYKKAFQEVYRLGLTQQLDCHALRWYLQDGFQIDSMHSDISAIWLSGHSLPKACDPLFKQWKQKGYLDDELILARLSLATSNGNLRLAKYLKKQLSAEAKYLARQWLDVAKQPKKVFNRNFFVLYNQAELDILRSVSRKLVFANPARFYTWWNDSAKPKFEKQIGRDNLRDSGLAFVDRDIAIALAVNNAPISLSLLNALPSDVIDNTVKQWRIARSLASNDWQQVLSSLQNLPEQFQVDPAVVYWQAKAKWQLGDLKQAKQVLAELAERRDYYGFLAAETLNKRPQIRHVPVDVEKRLRQQVSQNQSLQRALTFFEIGDTLAARKEWNYLETQLDEDHLLVAANLAANRGWVDRPIFLLSKLDYLNDVSLRFPMAYDDIIKKAANDQNLPASLLFAIARRESSFITDAYSSAGAAGLMQLKPSTASYVAKSRITKTDLFEPELNVNLAGRYLAKLKKQTNQHPVLMAASYNAGFSNVKQWLPSQAVASDKWIETIPFHETRNYVKAVVAYQKVYDVLLKSEQRGSNNLFEPSPQLRAEVERGQFGNITSLHVQPEI